MPRQASGRYLLTGILRCPRCGARMCASGRGWERHGNPRYVCGASHQGAAANDLTCRYQAVGHPVDAAVLGEVADLIDVVLRENRELQAALSRAWKALSRPPDDTARLARAHEQAAAKARERIKRLALLFADGDIDREGYDLGRGQAQADLEAAERELTRLGAVRPSPPMATLEEAVRLAGGWRAALTGGELARQREVLGALIESVTPDRVSHGKYRASIIWSDVGEQLRTLVARAEGAEQAA